MTDLSSLHALRAQLERVIVGQQNLLERLLIALLAGGHVLLEGPPGLAKTTAVHALASGVNADFSRVQFTPDLMPGDLTGSEVYEPDSGGFRFVPGPLFNQIVLAEEINRAPPKVQSALLEAMAEHQISVAGHSHLLPEPFMVLATQNPLEQAGTYSLPEAQLDRFLFHLILDYPSLAEEIEIARRARKVSEGHVESEVTAQLQPEALLELRSQVDSIHIDPRVEHFAVELVVATRDPGQYKSDWSQAVMAGASPRGSIALLRAAMARALLDGRDFVLPEDVSALAKDVLRHRMTMSFNAQAEGLSADQLIQGLMDCIEQP